MSDDFDFSKELLEALNGRVDELSPQDRWDTLVELVAKAAKRATFKRKKRDEAAKENQVRNLLSSIDR